MSKKVEIFIETHEEICIKQKESDEALERLNDDVEFNQDIYQIAVDFGFI